MQAAQVLRFACLALIAIASIAPTGCKREPNAPELIRVQATTYALADIVRQIGGQRVRVGWWIESGQPLDELVESPERRTQFNNADLVVSRGQTDPWTIVGSGNAYQDRRILRVDTLSAVGSSDPSHYIWLDPRVAMELADELADRLSMLEPRSEAYFKSNRDAFVRQAASIIEQASSAMYQRDGTPFLTLDRGFAPLARRFGMQETRAPSVLLTEPSAYNVKTLRKTATSSGAGAVFASSETPIALLRDWENRLGMPVIALDPVGTSIPSGRSTYLELLQYNLDQLQRGVSLSASAPRGPKPLGAVINASGGPQDDSMAPPAGDVPTTTTAPAAAANPWAAPAPRPPTASGERVRVPVPVPTTQRRAPSPFKPIPTVQPAPPTSTPVPKPGAR